MALTFVIRDLALFREKDCMCQNVKSCALARVRQALSDAPRGNRFASQSGRMSGLWAQFPCSGRAGGSQLMSLSLISVSISLSPHFCSNINTNIFFFNGKSCNTVVQSTSTVGSTCGEGVGHIMFSSREVSVSQRSSKPATGKRWSGVGGEREPAAASASK